MSIAMSQSSINTDFVSDFTSVQGLPATDRVQAYSPLLERIVSQSPSSNNLVAYLTSLLQSDRYTIVHVPAASESLNLIALRPLLSSFIAKLQTLPSNDMKVQVYKTAIDLIQPRVNSFEEQDATLKLLLADAYEADDEYTASAQVLQSINLDASSKTATDTEKAEVWVRIARCYIQDDDHTLASSYINRAKNVIHNVKDSRLRLFYHSAQARVLDSQRSFIDASLAYHTLSFEPLVDEDDRLQALSAAITCAILAPAGPQRSRTLARLYKDERASTTQEFPILEKIFLDRILHPAEVSQFASRLAPHQLATTSDGSTVLDRAVLEHNLLGVSKLYRNIGIEQLGKVLGVDGDKAEQHAAHMIEQKRMTGCIDQIEGIIFFDSDTGALASKGSVGQEVQRWNKNVQAIAEDVEKVTSMIQSQYPDLHAAITA